MRLIHNLIWVFLLLLDRKLLIMNNSISLLFLILSSSLIIVLICTPVVIRVAFLKRLMDEPDNRSSHLKLTPTLGGVTIFAGVIISSCIFINFSSDIFFQLYVAAVIILLLVGVKDDILILSPVKKLLAQILSSLIVIIGSDLRIINLYGIFGIFEVPYLVSVLLTLFVFISLINAYNLIDGIDGLAGGLGIISSACFGCYFTLNGNVAFSLLCFSLVGALLGFLYFNYSKTYKIFMGDTGSMIVGFSLSSFAVQLMNMYAPKIESENVFNAPLVAGAILFIPIFDTLYVFITRTMSGKSPFYADKNHIHHILIQRGYSHVQSSIILYLLQLFVVGFTVLFFENSTSVFTIFAFFLVLIINIVVNLVKKYLKMVL